MFFANSVWFCIAQKHKRPASFLCSLRAVSYPSLSPSPVVWFSLRIYRYPHFFCPTMCKLWLFMLPCSPFFRTKSHKLFLWRKITELTKLFFSVISEQKILSTLMQRIPFKIMPPSSIDQSYLDLPCKLCVVKTRTPGPPGRLPLRTKPQHNQRGKPPS